MNKIAPSLAVLAIMLASFAYVAPARAEPPLLTWVAGDGVDTDNCTRAQPCRTFAAALANTAAGGEIRVLSRGSFGPAKITKSVSIVGDMADSGIFARSDPNPLNAIVIQAGEKDIVNLRGLVIDGGGVGLAGIRFESGAALHVQNCLIRGFQAAGANGWGIQFVPSKKSELYVSDTLIANNGPLFGSNTAAVSGGGILIQTVSGGSARAFLSRVQLEKNSQGLLAAGVGATGALLVSIVDSVVAGSKFDGISGSKPANGNVPMMIIDRTASLNNGGVGVVARGTVLYMNNSIVSGNRSGLLYGGSGGSADYSNNNSIVGNGTKGAGPNVEEPLSNL
jgi:hypothetical protein